jgi:ketopantoate hydroxymethyltransferase
VLQRVCAAAAHTSPPPSHVEFTPSTVIQQCYSNVSLCVHLLEETLVWECAGGAPARVAAVGAIVRAGVACMGHIGLTPQSVSALGGFRPQARDADAAVKLVNVALVSALFPSSAR